MAETPLDIAHKAMETDPDDAHARLRFYACLADSELFLLLASRATGDALIPEVFEADNNQYSLAFDCEERLLDFTGKPAFFATLSGRELAIMLAGQGVGIGLNLDVAPSSILLPGSALTWLTGMLENAPDEVADRPVSIAPPMVPESLIAALDAKLAKAAGLARRAYLVAVEYEAGRGGHLLAIIDAVPTAKTALAKAVSEAVGFSGTGIDALDVGFFAATDPFCVALEKTGLRFDLPEVKSVTPPTADPTKPPILR